MSSRSDFVAQMYQAGLAAGLTDAAARVMAAQAGIESSYGTNAPGFNYFGITKGKDWAGPTIVRTDHNAAGEKVRREFRAYPSAEAGVADRIKMMDDKFPGFNNAKSMSEALAVLQNGKLGKYYEAPQAQYENAVAGINKKYLPDAPASVVKVSAPASHPVPPLNVPGSNPINYLKSKQAPGAVGGIDGLNPEFATRLSALMQAAEDATGDKVSVFEGQRDQKRQAQLYANYRNIDFKWEGTTYHPTGPDVGKYKAAKPGNGLHALGMATDIRAGADPTKIGGPAYEWMHAHAAEFGLRNDVANDPAHFQMPEAEWKSAAAGSPVMAFAFPGRTDGSTGNAALDAIAGQTGNVSQAAAPTPAEKRQAFFDAQAANGTRPDGMTLPTLRKDGTVNTGYSKGYFINADYGQFGNSTAVAEDGIGALADSRTASLIGGQSFDTVGDGPNSWFPVSPIQLLDHHENENGGLHFGSTPQSAASVAAINALHDLREGTNPSASAVAPVPMPGRPADKPAAVAPTPMPGRPADKTAPAAVATPDAKPQTIRVGKHDYTVGTQYEQGGFRYTVTSTGIEKARIPTGEKTVLGGIIGTVVGDAAKQAAPQVSAAIGNAAEAVKINAGEAATTIGNTIGGFGSSLVSGIGGLFGHPADGITTEHVGTQNGRPVIEVSGTPSFSRAKLDTIHDARETTYVPSRITAAMFSPTSFRFASQPLSFTAPKTLGEALAGTSYAAIGASVDQRFTKPDPVLESVHDKRETQQVQAIQKAPAPSASIVKPQGGTKATTPGTDQTGTTQMPPDVRPSVGGKGGYEAPLSGPGTWGDFTKAVGVPLPAPAKLAPPAQRVVAPVPTRPATVTTSVENPAHVEWVRKYGVGSVNPNAVSKLQDIHDRQDSAPMSAQTSVPPEPPKTITQVKTQPVTAAPEPVTISQPTTKTAGAPSVPVKAPNAPIYVDKATGARLAPQTVNVYNPDTNSWAPRTVYRPVASQPAAAAKTPAPPAPSKPSITSDQLAGANQGFGGAGAVMPDSMNNSRWLTGY